MYLKNSSWTKDGRRDGRRAGHWPGLRGGAGGGRSQGRDRRSRPRWPKPGAELKAKGYEPRPSSWTSPIRRASPRSRTSCIPHGGIDILVNNAGIARSETPAEKVADEHWLNVIDVNLNGTFWCCRAFGKHMLDARSGAIVNIGSMSGFIVNKPQEQSYYNASKAAVHHLTKSLAAEWGARGVRVNAVAPTYIETPLNAFVKSNPQMYDAWIGGTPMARMGEVDEIASVVLFLASDAASLMTGSIVLVDGGYTCWWDWRWPGAEGRNAGKPSSASTSGHRAPGPACSTRTERLLATARHPITVWHEAGNVVEQSSSEIWAACADAVRAAMAEAACRRRLSGGMGFDATCSLVVLDLPAQPAYRQRVRRRAAQCHRLDGPSRHGRGARRQRDADDVLRYVGGSISPEMEIPKLLWLKRHLPSTYRSAGHFFDLADYLSFRATGSTARSMCTLTCKWNFLAHEGRWSRQLFRARRPGRPGLGRIRADRNGDRRARHAAGRRPDRSPPRTISACSRARRSARR